MALNFSTIQTTGALVDADKIVVGQAGGDGAAPLSSLVTYLEGKTLSLTGDLTGNVTGNVTGDLTGHSSLDLPLTGGVLTGDLTTVDILPDMTGATGDVSVRNIGSAAAKFNSVYADEVFVGASSLYVNGKTAIQDNSSVMTFATDIDQGVEIKTSSSTPGSGSGNLTLSSGN